MEIIKNDNDLKTDEKSQNKNNEPTINTIPIAKNFIAEESIISLCLIA